MERVVIVIGICRSHQALHSRTHCSVCIHVFLDLASIQLYSCGLFFTPVSIFFDLVHSGKTVVLVPGGAAESLDSRPGTADLTLQRRLGFVRLAIESGADLIPVFSFGETDAFDQVTQYF